MEGEGGAYDNLSPYTAICVGLATSSTTMMSWYVIYRLYELTLNSRCPNYNARAMSRWLMIGRCLPYIVMEI